MPTRRERMEALETMHEIMEGFTPIREAIIGFRASLIADGWSEPVAEQIAATFFTETLRKVMRA